MVDRFWPSLIDRLDGRDREAAPIEDHFVDQKTLQAMIKASLEDLLNTVNYESTESLEGFDRIRRSVINYGIPSITGHMAGTFDVAQVQRRIREAILAFEPRFRPETLRVQIVTQSEDGSVDQHRPVELSIEGEIYATPTPERVVLRTLMDLEDGSSKVVVE